VCIDVRFEPTRLAGVWLIDIEHHADHRGFFARGWSSKEFGDRGLPTKLAEIDLSYSHLAGTIRGLHFSMPPVSEPKFVRCIRGATHEVIIDLRRDSPTFGEHVTFELSADSHRALFVPDGLAQGHQTLVDNTEVQYFMSEAWVPGYESGVRWDDAAFGIRWPLPVSAISDRDSRWPDFDLDAWRQGQPRAAG
jgi:dTDP-4-dehydrorhamnose 3,5-epimerase